MNIVYTDDTTDSGSYVAIDEDWHYLDLLPYVTIGKTMKQITFAGNILGYSHWGSSIDDVSLIATG